MTDLNDLRPERQPIDVNEQEPVVNDPILLVDFLQLLSVKGNVGKLRVADVVLPTVSLGQVSTPAIQVRQPAFRSTDVFSNGILSGPAANAVMADTGQLEAGVYDVQTIITPNTGTITQRFAVEHRDAANAANLAVWNWLHAGTPAGGAGVYWSLGYEFAANERLRIINLVASNAGETVAATIFARRRT